MIASIFFTWSLILSSHQSGTSSERAGEMEQIPGTIIFKNHAKVLVHEVEYRAPAGKGGFARFESDARNPGNHRARPRALTMGKK